MKLWLLRARQNWTDLAASIGTFQARVLLTVLYFTWMVPFGLLARFLSDPLAVRDADRQSVTTGWKRRSPQGRTIQALRNQY